MDTLEEWLASTVNSDLGHVLQWLLDNSNRDNARGTTGKLDFEDDGTYLRVKSKRVGTAQIAKVLPLFCDAHLWNLTRQLTIVVPYTSSCSR